MSSLKAIILLSGGLDSATTAVFAQNKGYELSAITFIYNQKHDIEIQFAKEVVQFLKIKIIE